MKGSYSRSLRHPHHNYSKQGYYFVTLVVKDRAPYFGTVINGKMIRNDYGEFAYRHWINIPKYCEGIVLDDFIIMPEHIHGILRIKQSRARNLEIRTEEAWQKKWSQSLSSVIRGYKSGVTKYFRISNNYEFGWVRSYHDYIIKNDYQLQALRRYIRQNPIKYRISSENYIIDIARDN